MIIQLNTDHNLRVDAKAEKHFSAIIHSDLEGFESHITRIEVHLSDENGSKSSLKDKRCLLEARVEGKQPIAVSYQDDTVELALSGALELLRNSLESIQEREKNY
ncbi:ribosomal subunit interface protein [Algoriphagus marinus]|uniref:ribosomal subunit interface protein n=1 Tax=Algoriphagus marinus TaxID=1925762 RepID=UPI00094B866C|nr:ribosomal subunit interface protein [Algoriphagus marinus]